ncbi:hypothetical protein VP1G_04248 [Cytospora mali]|uniref:Uncharacterized protein n=1 Tax=Cytospora mali TaxID=578113 RepID=A0A194UZB7_CYTMA|nr:hypothetical protein VP1G_04248 [Valsa mali var. pyri (nom. inval.)]
MTYTPNSNTWSINPPETAVKQEGAEVQSQAPIQAQFEVEVALNAQNDVHHEGDNEETFQTEKFPEYDDPFKRTSHPFWRQGWYDTKKGFFVIYDGRWYMFRERPFPYLNHDQDLSPAGLRGITASRPAQTDRQRKPNAPGTKKKGGDAHNAKGETANVRAGWAGKE